MPLTISGIGAAVAAASSIAQPIAAPREPIRLPVQDPSARSGGNSFNPQISIVGDFVGTLDDNSGEKKRFDFREIEFGFAADADPFLKVEAYIAVANEDGETIVEVEEAFGRYSNLGKGMSAKFGKFAAAVGRVQRNHGDQLPYLSYPMAVQDALGEEGLRRPGASLSYLFPGDRFNELTLELLDAGDEGPVFNDSSLDSPVYVGHYRTFFDFSADTSAQLGFTAMTGPTMGSSSRGSLFGVDYTMKFQPEGMGRTVSLEAEGYWSKPGGASESKFGGFARATVEVQPRWFITGGIDYSEIPGTSDIRRGWLANATLKVTEFHHWRVEYQEITSNFEGRRNMLNLQFVFVIGAHPAHKY